MYAKRWSKVFVRDRGHWVGPSHDKPQIYVYFLYKLMYKLMLLQNVCISKYVIFIWLFISPPLHATLINFNTLKWNDSRICFGLFYSRYIGSYSQLKIVCFFPINREKIPNRKLQHKKSWIKSSKIFDIKGYFTVTVYKWWELSS